MISDKVKDTFRKVRDQVLTSEDRWTKGAYARLADGGSTLNGWDQGVSCWCLAGALEYITGALGAVLRNECYSAFNSVIGEGMIGFNDPVCRTFAEVQEALTKVIEA